MIRETLNAILDGRAWSWSVIGMLAILFGIIVRGIVLRDSFIGLKIKDRTSYKNLQKLYQERSWYGWVFFAMYVSLVSLFWRFEDIFLQKLGVFYWISIFLFLLMISIFCHMRAYIHSLIELLENKDVTHIPEQSA